MSSVPAVAWRRLLLVCGAAGLIVLGLAGAASAHVTVNPSTATQGGYTKLTFRVPNETDKASTTKVAVFFPADQPLASVSVKPHPGWTYAVRTEKLAKPISSDDGSITRAVSQITWTAQSARTAIKPGEFDEFDVSVGPLPTAPSMTFKTLQTYSDGTVVRWIDVSTGSTEPAHPAPVLTLTPAGSAPSGSAPSGSPAGTSGTAVTALVLAIVALVVAIGAAGLAVLRRSRS